MTRLRQQQLDQRIATGESAFRRLGHVDVARQTGSPQTIVFTVVHPGWGARTTARVKLVETWIQDGAWWALTRYGYDLVMRGSPGRFGFHWHDGTYHTHCVDPAHPDRDHHFSGEPIDLFFAFDQFAAFLNGKVPMTCAGLRSLGRQG